MTDTTQNTTQSLGMFDGITNLYNAYQQGGIMGAIKSAFGFGGNSSNAGTDQSGAPTNTGGGITGWLANHPTLASGAAVLGQMIGGPVGGMLTTLGVGGITGADAIQGYKQGGIPGALTQGLDGLITSGIPALAAGMGGGLISTLFMGVIGSVLANVLLKPLVHFLEQALGLPVPGQTGTQANNGGNPTQDMGGPNPNLNPGNNWSNTPA
ncbi:MAG: hypothetical protein WCD70_04415, partial [Alphaproteobacteria bacterium]